MRLVAAGVRVLHKIGTGLVVVDAALLVLVFASSVIFSWTVPRVEVTTSSGNSSTATTTSVGAPAAVAGPTPTIDIWNPPEGW